ncbi:MAG: hypothetical protein IJS88_01480 [Alphaproteobacteria bacterium]|nr:hypothetical protein [Alphaproteobacteria bacterium]
MKKIFVILGCAALLLSACGKDESNEQKMTIQKAEIEENISADVIDADVNEAVEEKAQEVVVFEDNFTKKVGGNTEKFKKEFKKLSAPQQYYFCAAFAMGAMAVAKPITASAMVNYFLGLGAHKYGVGINDDTYMAFNAGKNSFLHEDLVNVILQDKICENLINEATDYAVEKKQSVADLDKLGQIEVEKVVEYIQRQ